MTPNEFTVKFTLPVTAAAPLADATVSPKAAKPKAQLLAAESASKPDDLMTRAWEYIKANEGVRYEPYKDSKGLWTIGVGSLMSPEDIKALTGKKLTEKEVNYRFTRDLTAKEKLARAKLGPAFDRMPIDTRVAVLDGMFRGDLSGSPKTLKLLREGKFEEASTEYLNNAEYRDSVAMNKRGKAHGVARRMERNAERFRAAARAKP